MSSPTLVHATPWSEPTLVVFGHDGTGKPRASWSDAVNADLMNMRVLKIETEKQQALALPLAC